MDINREIVLNLGLLDRFFCCYKLVMLNKKTNEHAEK